MTQHWQPISFDCTTFECKDACCRHGADVFPHERDQLVQAGLARPEDFVGPELDDAGDWLFRTRTNSRGCVFLLETRGCRLHPTGKKPAVCIIFPRDVAEVHEAYQDGDLPCYPAMNIG